MIAFFLCKSAIKNKYFSQVKKLKKLLKRLALNKNDLYSKAPILKKLPFKMTNCLIKKNCFEIWINIVSSLLTVLELLYLKNH